MFKNGYCVVCGRKVKNESVCKTCFSYEMKLAEKGKELYALKTQLINGEKAWKNIIIVKDKQLKRIMQENIDLKKELKIKIIEELKKLQKETNAEATEDGYVDAVWFDRLIDIKIKKLEAE